MSLSSAVGSIVDGMQYDQDKLHGEVSLRIAISGYISGLIACLECVADTDDVSEVEAMADCWRVLDSLKREERHRVVEWLRCKSSDKTVKENQEERDRADQATEELLK